MLLAPIVIFTYRRVPNQLINSILNNNLSEQSELFIYSDGAKSDTDYEDVEEVRKYLKTVVGFKSIKIIESDENKGLANSIINGVSEVIDIYGMAIVLEDDLIVSSDFLEYMNDALNFYDKDKRIWSISGYGPKLPCFKNYKDDVYLSVRGSSWGWATWKDRWGSVDWEVKDFDKLEEDESLKNKFNLGGNDMFKMLELQLLGKIDSWAIRWCFTQFTLATYTVYPKKSKVINDGFRDLKGTHNSRINNKWAVELDNEKINLKNIHPNETVVKCFKRFYNISIGAKVSYFLRKYGFKKPFKNRVKKTDAM